MSQSESSTGVPDYAAPPTAKIEPEAEEPAKIGPVGRLTGVLFSPGETFQDVNRKPTIVVPLVMLVVLSLAGYFVFVWKAKPNWDAVIRAQVKKQAERSGQPIPEEQLQRQVDIGKKIATFTPAIVAIGVPIFAAILAGIFALGMILLQAKTTYKKLLSVVAWSFVSVGVVGLIVTIASLMVQDTSTLSGLEPDRWSTVVPTNLGALVDPGSPALRSLFAALDIFTIWRLVLFSIGFAAVAGSRKITSSKTATMVFGLWFVWILVSMGWAAIRG